MQQITVHEAQLQFATMMLNVSHGEEIIITDHDEPIAKISPMVKPQPRDRVGAAKGMINWIADDFDETPEDFKDYL